jgi:hypothetical protein
MSLERGGSLGCVHAGAETSDAASVKSSESLFETWGSEIHRVVVREGHHGHVVSLESGRRLHRVAPMDVLLSALERRPVQLRKRRLEIGDDEIRFLQERLECSEASIVAPFLQEIAAGTPLQVSLIVLAEAGVAEKDDLQAIVASRRMPVARRYRAFSYGRHEGVLSLEDVVGFKPLSLRG